MQGDAARSDGAYYWKAKFKMGREPFVLKRIACLTEFLKDVLPVELDEVGEHETVVQRVPPVDQLSPIRFFPESGDERSHQELLNQTHARVRRHFKSPQLDQPQPGRSGVGRIKFVDANLRAMSVAGEIDQEVAKDAVDRPGTYEFGGAGIGDLIEGDLKLIKRVGARFIDARMLAGGTYEESGEEIGE